MTPERLMSLASAKGLAFDHIAGGGRPEWTAQETAMALSGLPADRREACYAAYAYRWARDDGQQATLQRHLRNAVWGHRRAWGHAEDALSYVERWPEQIRCQPYMDRLVRLAILEERFGHIVSTHRLWPGLFTADGFTDMDDDLWSRRLSRKYEAVRHIIEDWCATTRYHMRARMGSVTNEVSTACA